MTHDFDNLTPPSKFITTTVAEWSMLPLSAREAVGLSDYLVNAAYKAGAQHAAKQLEGQWPGWVSSAPPTLQEQALSILQPHEGPVMLSTPQYKLTEREADLIRQALKVTS